jgi:hypothetical protein
MKITPRIMTNAQLLAKAEEKEKPKNNPPPREPSPMEKLFLFILMELENIKKSGKPKA